MLDAWSRFTQWRSTWWFRPLVVTYEALSSAPVDTLWQKVSNLADVSWHPLIASTNVPKGLIPKPGLIYQAVSRLFPIPIQIFVERVRPREMLSVRILAIPGLEERVTYEIESTVCGTCVSYSVTLRGWLSPLVWSLIQPHAARVARELAQSAEQELRESIAPATPTKSFSPDLFSPDLFSAMVLACGLGYSLTAINS